MTTEFQILSAATSPMEVFAVAFPSSRLLQTNRYAHHDLFMLRVYHLRLQVNLLGTEIGACRSRTAQISNPISRLISSSTQEPEFHKRHPTPRHCRKSNSMTWPYLTEAKRPPRVSGESEIWRYVAETRNHLLRYHAMRTCTQTIGGGVCRSQPVVAVLVFRGRIQVG